MQYVTDYINRLETMLKNLSRSEICIATELIWSAYMSENTIYIIGNGGSASTASHMACDLSKGTAHHNKPRLNVVSLADNIATITAIGNDIAYEDIFLEQLRTRFKSGDVLIALSVSGNSPNIIKAVQWAKERGYTTIGMCGRDGGELYGIVECGILFPEDNYGPVEDGHLILNHIIVEHLGERILTNV